MTLKELVTYRRRIIEYYENKADLRMLEDERPRIEISSEPSYEDLKNALEEYEKQKEKFDKLCSEYHYDELKEKTNVKYAFPDIPQEEKSLLDFLDRITSWDEESSVIHILNIAEALAENSKFGDRILNDETLENIKEALYYNGYNYGYDFGEIKKNPRLLEIHEISTIYNEYLMIKENKEVGPSIENNFTELKQILGQHGMEKEAQQVSLLLEQMAEMQKNYNAVFQELKIVRNQLDQQQGMQQNPEKQSVIVNQLSAFENGVQKQYQQFQTMGKQISEKAGILVQKFKEVGIKALNNVCEFLGIKESLVKLKDMAQSNAVEMQNSIDKIDKIGFEVKSAVTHAKNAGRAIVGKEMIDSSTVEQFKIFEKLKVPYQQKKEKFDVQVEKLSNAIEKFENLEQTTAKLSVREKLRNNQALIAEKATGAEPKPEREKPLQQDISL